MKPTDEQDLSRLLNDAVSDVEPRSGIEAIRSLTHLTQESPMTNIRTWFLGGLGAAVATAAVIGGVMLAGNDDPSAKDPGVSNTPSNQASETPSDDPTDDPTDPVTVVDPKPVAVAAYFAGETPNGLRLYREFQQVQTTDKRTSAVQLAVSGTPDDPDYRTLWPAGSDVASVGLEGDVVTVDLSGNVHDRPSGMTAAQAQLAIEQVIFTAQAAVGEGRLPVQLLLDGSHTDQVLGQPASEPLANGSILDTLAMVNITTPGEGETVSGTLDVSGVGNSFEATFQVRLQRYEGTAIAFQDFITGEGCCENKLFPFSKAFDISDVEPGRYLLMVSTDDPSGGAEGAGPTTDTKVITIG